MSSVSGSGWAAPSLAEAYNESTASAAALTTAPNSNAASFNFPSEGSRASSPALSIQGAEGVLQAARGSESPARNVQADSSKTAPKLVLNENIDKDVNALIEAKRREAEAAAKVLKKKKPRKLAKTRTQTIHPHPQITTRWIKIFKDGFDSIKTLLERTITQPENNSRQQETLQEFQTAVVGKLEQLIERTTAGNGEIAKRLGAPGDLPISSSLSNMANQMVNQNGELKQLNKHAIEGNKNTAKAAKAAEKANEKKPPERPKAAFPELISNITESAARGLAKLVIDTPWAKNALKGVCHTSETMIWLVGLGLSLPMILPTILYGTVASLPTIGLSAIALLALATVGKHFMACLKYELNHTPPASGAVKETAAKAGG